MEDTEYTTVLNRLNERPQLETLLTLVDLVSKGFVKIRYLEGGLIQALATPAFDAHMATKGQTNATAG